MLENDELLTQYGDTATNPCFHVAPDDDEEEVSLIAGVLSGAEACSYVRTRGCARHHVTCVARHVRVGTLRRAGFRVENTPTRVNPNHCSVWWDPAPGGDWPAEVSRLFDSCFDGSEEGQRVRPH